jgi:hypothetical protein
MSTNAESGLAELRARMKAQNDYAGEHGEAWVKRLENEFARLPKGTHVAINCRTGEYVLGGTALEAVDQFERRFGKGKEIGYMIEIGGGIFVGGGIV